MASRTIEAKVYLEGVEVRFQSVHINETVGSHMTSCQIALPPSIVSRNIEERTLVHVFVRRSSPAGGDDFTCVFEGEVGSKGWSIDASGGRAYHVVAYGLSNYWRFVKMYYVDRSAGMTNTTAGSAATEQTDENRNFESQTIPLFSVTRAENQNPVVLSSTLHETFSGKTFREGLIDLFKLVYEKDESRDLHYQFVIDANDRLRLVDRLLTSVSEVGNFMNEETYNFYITQLMVGHGGFIDFSAILQLALGTIFHDYIVPSAPIKVTGDSSISARRRSIIEDAIRNPTQAQSILSQLDDLRDSEAASGKPGSYIFKPTCYFVPPPTCNVLFPGQYTSEQFARNMFEEPTRGYFPSHAPNLSLADGAGIAEQSYTKPIIAPRSRFANVELVTGRSGSIVDGAPTEGTTLERLRQGDVLWGFEYSFLTEDELRNGMLPFQAAWPPLSELLEEEQVKEGSNQGDRIFQDERWQNIADFIYWKAYYSVGRTQQVQCEYSPQLIAGFPMITLDASPAKLHVVGYLQSVSHYLDAQGRSSSSATMTLCRDVMEERPSWNDSSLPPWFDPEIFADDRIGRTFYPEVLGSNVGAISDFGEEGEDLIESGADALVATFNRLRDQEGGSDNATSYMDVVTDRQRLTRDEIFGFIGATRANDGSYVGGSLDEDRRAVILEHAALTASDGQEG